MPVRPSPRSLTLDLLSTLRRGAMPVRALVEAAGFFGIEANALRVALARLLAEGLVERDERGLYRLGDAAGAIERWTGGWRDPEARMRRWDGAWLAAFAGERAAAPARSARRRSERALRITGFRTLRTGLHLRPDNLAEDLPGVRASLAGLGLEPGTLVCRLDDLDAASDARARALWDVAALRRGARDATAALARSAKRLPKLAPRAAMAESFLVGGHAIRVLTLDPLLPEAIDPGDERRALVAAMQRYDRLGRAAWSEFLREHGVPHARGAADVRRVEAADALSAAGGA
jgi:phenylacetic acid degradation operon negative regulatory protein